MRNIAKGIMTLLFVTMLVFGAQAEEGKVVKTDGTGDSKIKTSNLDFYDSGYGYPGAGKTIRANVDFKNTSDVELKNVSVKINLIDETGQTLRTWETKVAKLAPGAGGTVQEDGLYYNTGYFFIKPHIEIVYTEPVPEEDSEKASEE